jgi:adenylate cyclase
MGDTGEMAKPVDWHRLLVDGYEPLKKGQRIFRRLPSDPRCKLCLNPFGGVGGKLCGVIGRKPSRKNPNLCQYCFDHLPPGGIEIDLGVLFADVRNSTAMGESSTASDFAQQLNRFYAVATKVLIRHDGLIDKLIGDEVMGLFLPGLSGPDYRRKTARAAIDLAAATSELPVGVAANAGVAFVGSVGSGTVLDFTALSDAINVGASLQSYASARQVVLSSDLYNLIAPAHPGARTHLLPVKGRAEPVPVAVLDVTARHPFESRPTVRSGGSPGPRSPACSCLLALLDGLQQRDTEPRAAVPVPKSEPRHRALADVLGVLPCHRGGVGNEQLPTRAQHPHGLVHGPVPAFGERMLWIASALVTISKESSAKGNAVMSAVCTSTRSATPAATALASVASGRLPLWSLDHKSTPTARPAGSRLAASISTAPRPQPRSSNFSLPVRPARSSSRSQMRNLPRSVVCRKKPVWASRTVPAAAIAVRPVRRRAAAKQQATPRRRAPPG